MPFLRVIAYYCMSEQNALKCNFLLWPILRGQGGEEAQAVVEAFRQEYNDYRPRRSPGYLTPAEFTRRYYKENHVKGSKRPLGRAGSLSF